MEYILRDKDGGNRPLYGRILGYASSKSNSPRWIEFTIYKSDMGNYAVERVGKSEVFHKEECYLVNKNHLSSVPYSEIPGNYQPCERCRPSRASFEGLYPERDRPVTMVCETPRGVIKWMEQTDDDSVRYLTNVARRALLEASKHDQGIHDALTHRSVD